MIQADAQYLSGEYQEMHQNRISVNELQEIFDQVGQTYGNYLREVSISEGGFKFDDKKQRACAAALTIVHFYGGLLTGNLNVIDLHTGHDVSLLGADSTMEYSRYPIKLLVNGFLACVDQPNATSFAPYGSKRGIDFEANTTGLEFIKKTLEYLL